VTRRLSSRNLGLKEQRLRRFWGMTQTMTKKRKTRKKMNLKDQDSTMTMKEVLKNPTPMLTELSMSFENAYAWKQLSTQRRIVVQAE